MAYTAIGQSVYLLTGPLLGRLFTPAQFGLYGLFYTFAVTAVGLMFLNYDFAIPAAANDDDARQLTIVAASISLISAPLIGIFLAFLSWRKVGGFGDLEPSCAFLLVVVLLCQGIIQLCQNWIIRDNRTIAIGKASITLNIVRGATQVATGIASASWWGLALGEMTGRIGNAWHLARHCRWKSAHMHWQYSRVELWATLRRYRQFPLLLLPSQMLDSGVSFAQSAALAYFFGPGGLGMFFLMRRTLDLPVAFVFRSLSDIFYARQARDARLAPERVRPFFMQSVCLLAGGGLLVGMPLMIASPALFSLVFGAEWRQAGVLAAIMAPAAIMNLAVAPVARIFALTARPHLRFWFSAANLGGTVLALLAVKIMQLDLVGATIALSIATFTAYLVYFVAGYVASGALLSPEPVGKI